MVPLLVMRKVFLKIVKKDKSSIIRSGFAPPSTFVNKLLRSLGWIETNLFSSPLIGTSVLASIKKK